MMLEAVSSHRSHSSSPCSSYLFSEYRSAIFTNTPEQLEIAKSVTDEVQKKHFDPKGKKIVTEITPAGEWYDAET
jgi:peptide methionine sulfoxide reductase MsrA